MDLEKDLNPVVVLERIPSLEIAGHRTVFSVRECEDGHNGDFKLCSNAKTDSVDHQLDLKEMRLSEADMSDSDDDLPGCGLNIPAPKLASTADKVSDYKSSFAEIFNNQSKLEKDIAATLKSSVDLEAMVKASTAESSSSALASELGLDEDWHQQKLAEWMLPSKNIIDKHPGAQIIDLATKGKLFNRKQLTFEEMENPVSSVDILLQRLSWEMIDEIIKSRSFTLYFPRLTDKSAAIRLLFYLISVHEDQLVTIKIKDMLLSLLKKYPTYAVAIGLKEVFEVLVNSGTTLKKLIPVPELVEKVERIVVFKAAQNVEEQLGASSEEALEHSLKYVLRVLQYLIRSRVSSTLLEPDHLTILIVAISTLAMDTKLRHSDVLVEIRVVLDDLLLQFSADEWTNRAILLAKYLSSLSDVPQNMAFVALMFCYSDRGHHLQRLTSFTMCHKLLDIEPPEDVHDVAPQAVLSLIKSMPKSVYDNLCNLYNVLVLVNLSVGSNFLQENSKVQQDLILAVKKIANGIKQTLDGIKIRDLATNMYSKWNILANAQPKSQKSLFVRSDASDDESS